MNRRADVRADAKDAIAISETTPVRREKLEVDEQSRWQSWSWTEAESLSKITDRQSDSQLSDNTMIDYLRSTEQRAD